VVIYYEKASRKGSFFVIQMGMANANSFMKVFNCRTVFEDMNHGRMEVIL